MSTLRENIAESNFREHVLTDTDLEVLFDGTPASRYGLVNKALNKHELIRIRRGLYILADKYRQKKISKFYLASQMEPLSYISMESALSYFGWIPEHVVTVTSVLAEGRTKKFVNHFGEFVFYQIPVNEYEYLRGIQRIEEIKKEPFLIASPLRALADYIYIKKIDYQNINFITDGLRIDFENLIEIETTEFQKLMNVYRSKRVLNFLKKLKQELKK